MKNRKKKLLFFAFICITVIGYSQQKESNTKLLQHVLLFQWTDNINEETKSKVLNLFEGLPNKIDGLESYEILEVTTSSGNFDDVLIFQFASEEALKIYEEHPDHLVVKELAPTLISGFAAYDYWE